MTVCDVGQDGRCAYRLIVPASLIPRSINMDRPIDRKVLWINRFMDRIGAGPPSFRPPVARFSGSGLQASEGAPSPPRLFYFGAVLTINGASIRGGYAGNDKASPA